MTTPPPPASTTGALHTLSRDQCLQLLRRERVGRIALVSTAGQPLIRPVNYVFDEASQSVVFRSRVGSKLYALSHRDRASFEIDSGANPSEVWSVIVSGVIELISHPQEIARLERLGLDTAVPVEPSTWARVRSNVVSGRRLD